MGCFAVDTFERSDEMEFRKAGFVSDIVKIDRILIMRINKNLCLDQPSVEIKFWILLIDHKQKIRKFATFSCKITQLRTA